MKKFFNMLKNFFTAPVFEGDKEKTQSAKLLYQIITVIWGLPVLLIAIMVLNATARREVLPPAFVISITLLALMVITRMGRLGVANTIITAMVVLVFSYADFQNAGNIQPSTLVIAIAIIMSGLLLGRRAPIVVAILIAISHGVIVSLQMRGVIELRSAPAVGIENIVITSIMILMISFLFQFVISRLQSAVDEARKNEREFRELSVSLEQRVAERTKALTTSAEVSRRLASILDPHQLSQEVVNQVQTAFNYYYAQIYLFDSSGENLVMTAGTGAAGTALMKVGRTIPQGRGLIGRAAETKESVLVSDTSQDPNWVFNEMLPNTKAEAVVPIIIGDRLLGVLDVQDDITNDINPADVTLLESLASQIAISLQNASLYETANSALQDAQSLVDNAPEAIIVVDLATGLFANPNDNAVKLYGLEREELVKVGPAQMSPPRQPDGGDSTEKAMEKIGEAMQGGTPTCEWMHRNGQGEDFLCEIRLVRLPGEHPRVRASVTNISERKRNEDLTSRRAQQQEALNLITQRIQSATTIESALQVTARELGRALGMKPTLVTLEPDSKNGESQSAS